MTGRREHTRMAVASAFCAFSLAAWLVLPKERAYGNPVTETDDRPVVFVDDASVAAAQDFARFDHRTVQHARMPCLLCHKREAGVTKPKMPGHTACAACHVEQFADNQNALCSICHTPTSVKPFPRLRSFGANFSHSIHVRQTGCATCHKPIRRGVAFSLPSDAGAHASCFQCHGPRTEIGGRNIGSCGTCHTPGRLVLVSANAKAFSINFSHSEHKQKGTGCAGCHTVERGGRRGSQVTSPAAAMHFAPARRTSCATCHNNRRAFGPPDFADCKLCHEGRTFKL